ncbi:hypothetical protein JG687_00015381 [Phytophthora cactorum]|uniref:Mitochondrial carrier domain n=2 Tax=Phytophthora cactorum TaxID=29920 RepID=A0A8T1TX33_9STRA|nr:hypothetical protein PC120_g20413 [Phytophthora cactorum]KAG3048798.1 hypothetical protein PC121_g19284 [Phytophthora cactorum]KAG3156384.1 hypothetical protein PC128_g21881 [Phytophthora cactorum]KAG4043129.1 hypothetical protein PC123_g21396 [Phytophthora cactorum]KAG6948596.1 hypothetical protein JG687_00015381 [Phytophthora cactorum]
MVLRKPMEMMAAVTAAGCGSFLSTTIHYPLDTLKTPIQSGASLLPEGEEDDGPISHGRTYRRPTSSRCRYAKHQGKYFISVTA